MKPNRKPFLVRLLDKMLPLIWPSAIEGVAMLLGILCIVYMVCCPSESKPAQAPIIHQPAHEICPTCKRPLP